MRHPGTISLLIASLISAIDLGAQSVVDPPVPPATAPGSPIPSYAFGGVDSVNYFNGSLDINIPLVNVSGRSDTAQSLILPVQNTWTVDQATFAPVPSVINGYVQYGIAGALSIDESYTGTLPCLSLLTWVVWTSSNGTETNLADEKTNGAMQPGGTGPSCPFLDRGQVFHSYDGSSLTYINSQDVTDANEDPVGGTLFLPNGTRYLFGSEGSASTATVQDRNGNQTVQQFSGNHPDCTGGNSNGIYTITDSAGRTVTVDYTTTPSCGVDTIQYTGSTQSGAPQRTITVHYGQLQSLLIAGLPLGQSAQYSSCLFPQLNGSSQTPYNPYVISSVVLPDNSAYSFLYDYYGQVAQMTIPAGGVIQYKWLYPTSCTSDPGGLSGAIVWSSSGHGTIYRRVQERDEYANANGISGGMTGRTIFTPTSLPTPANPNVPPDSNHPTRSGGYGVQVDADFQNVVNGSATQVRHETHWFYGDPSQPESIPASPIAYPAWSDGLEYQTQISQGGVTKQLQTRLWQQQPCGGCWFNQSPATPDTALRMNDPLVCQVNTTLDSTVTSGIVRFYDFVDNVTNNVTGQYEYDFPNGTAFGATCPSSPPANWFRSSTYTYLYSANSAYGPPTANTLLSVSLLNTPASKIVTGSDGSQSTDLFYYDQGTLGSVGSPPGHDNTDFPTSYTTRGNLTTHQVYQNETASYPAETFTWDITGRQLSYTDFNANSTTYTYGDTPHVFPTSITNALSQTQTYSYDANILQLLSATDANSVTTQYNYSGDPLDRLTSVGRANGQSNTTLSYPSTAQVTVKQDQNTLNDGALRTDTFSDGLGRQIETVVYENTSSTITTATAWDTLGRATSVSNPYRPGDTVYYTNYTYDALNRSNCITTSFDSAQSCTSYSGQTATATDAAGNAKTLTWDAAGRLKAVTEDPGSGHLNYQTTYQYDALDDLKTVAQGAQTRSFVFDSRGRLGAATNPETGTTTYQYDNNGNLVARTDNSGVTAGYGYDALNRILSVAYGGSGARGAPSVEYTYGAAGTTVADAVGRLVSVWNSAGTGQVITRYDAFGRITGSSETIGGTPSGSFGYTYNLADALVSTTYPTGRVVTNTYDGANRISQVAGVLQGAGKTYLSGATYAAFGGIGGFNYAYNNGVPAGARTFSYNGRLQLGEMHDQGSSLMDLKYFYGGAATSGSPGASSTINNGNPTGVVETAKKGSGTQYSFTQTYGYDPVNRLSAAMDTGGWTQNFSFDAYGNPWTTTNTLGVTPGDRLPTSNVYANNQSSYTGTQYDGAVGNQVAMGSSQLTFDAENRIVQDYNTTSVASTCYFYDGLGERVAKQTFGGNTCAGTVSATITYVYDAFGNLMVQTQTGTPPATPCLTCYLTWDHLGSVRMVSDTVAGGFTGFHDYAPFGEEVLNNNAGRSPDWGTLGGGTDFLSQRYTGAERDTETLLDFLQARYLANQQGRFVSADPAGNFVADPGNPQSWNMYSYVWSNPLLYVDPTGTDGDCPNISLAECPYDGPDYNDYPPYWIWGGSPDGYGGGGVPLPTSGGQSPSLPPSGNQWLDPNNVSPPSRQLTPGLLLQFFLRSPLRTRRDLVGLSAKPLTPRDWNPYSSKDLYDSVSARCMFYRGGDNPWGNSVRGCLAALYESTPVGVSYASHASHDHDLCYAAASDKVGPTAAAIGYWDAVIAAAKCKVNPSSGAPHD